MKYHNDTQGLTNAKRQRTPSLFPMYSRYLLRLAGFALLLVLAVSTLHAQSRKDLEDKRKRLIEEINQTETQLKQTQKSRETAWERYTTLQNQVRKRQLLITTLGEEVQFLDQSLERTNMVIEALNQDVKRLEDEFSKMMRSAYRQKLNNSTLAFLLSANGFNDALQRWRYLKQYEDYREKQARLILETQETLRDKITALEQRRVEKQQLLESEKHQKTQLSQELKDKDALLKDLTSSEVKLAKDLEKQRQQHEQLNKAIENIILAEVDKSKKIARSSEALEDNTTAAAAAADFAELTGEFQRWKGKLPWPVQSGTVARSFGEQPHPRFANVTTINNGIDISADGSTEVKAVFEGRVAGTKYIPGYQNMVIIQHGNYYTVYSNLETLTVKRDQFIKAGEMIGTLNSQNPEVHFEVWQEKKRLNPAQWIAKG